MRIAITGASGMVGTALAARLEAAGHEIVRLKRPGGRGDGPTWDPARNRIADGALEGCDAVVHLAGASIGEGRWTAARKRELRASRIDATRLLVQHLGTLQQRPKVLVSASAVGIYGDRGDERLTEASTRGTGFLADLVVEWEQEARAAEALGIRVVTPRFGVILDAVQGAFPRLLMPVKFGVGGPLGSGKQWMPWVTLTDVTRAMEFMLTHEVSGAFNVVAPDIKMNRDFTKAVAREVHRPAIFPVPPFALRLLLGGAADELLLASARVMPERLTEAGFEFQDATLEKALPAVLRKH